MKSQKAILIVWNSIRGKIAENKEENTDQHAIDFINHNLDIKTDKINIDRFHRIGRYDNAKKKAISIVVKFARYNVRGRVFRENRKLNGTGKSISESLTTKRIGQLDDEKEKYGFNNVWLYDGTISYRNNVSKNLLRLTINGC